ncbi:uncharacterized protein [Parasteatoda tepidariorum]|uniref:uncharacterized protein n=1 Tax=Parasteatoda tepidariorum TaxID=114398 RepID=UPI001C71EAFE|nr:uncharacterized protein LOC107448456 [Parasteatoda tepidariorum]
MSYTISSNQRSPQNRGAHTAASGQVPPARGTYVAPDRPAPPPRGTYVAPDRPAPPPRGTYVAPDRPIPPPRGTYVAPDRPAAPPRGTYVAPDRPAPPPRGTYVAPDRQAAPPRGTFVAPDRLVPPAARPPAFDSNLPSSGSSEESGPPSLTAGRLRRAPPNVPPFHYESRTDEVPEETEYEDDVFEPHRPARFRLGRIFPGYQREFYYLYAEKVKEYDLLWNGLVEILETYQPFTIAQEITCPLVLIETIKQLIIGQKLFFHKYKIDVTINNMTKSSNFWLVIAKIKRLHQHIKQLHYFMKEEIHKAVQENYLLLDQHLHLDSYLTYLEKKKQLLNEALTSYPYLEALRDEGVNEKRWSDRLRQKLIGAVEELNQYKESVCDTYERNILALCGQQVQMCKIGEELAVNGLFDAAIKSVLGESQGGEQVLEEDDEEVIEDWTYTLSEVYSGRQDHLLNAIESCENTMRQVTDQQIELLITKEKTEQLDFEVSLFTDNSALKIENIDRLKDIIRKIRAPMRRTRAPMRRTEDADVSARMGINLPYESFGQGLLDKSHLFSTPERPVVVPAAPDLPPDDQPLIQPPQLSSIQGAPSSGVAEADLIIDEAFDFFDQSPAREVPDQPLDLSRKQVVPSPRESPGDAEAAMVGDAFEFLDELSSSEVSSQPLQSTLTKTAETSQPREDDFPSDYSSFAADPPQSVFFPISERVIPKTKTQRSLIPKLDPSRMRKSGRFQPGYGKTDRPLYAISEQPTTSKTIRPPKGKKKGQPPKRQPWSSSTRIPTRGIRTKTTQPMPRSVKMKSSPTLGVAGASRIPKMKVKPRPRSLIPMRVPHAPYELTSPRTPFRTYNVPRPRPQLGQTFDTSLQLNLRSDDWRLRSKHSKPQTSRIPEAVQQSDITFHPTPPIYRRGWLRARDPIVPPFIGPLPTAAAQASRTTGAAPQMDGTFTAAPQMDGTFTAAPDMNRTIAVAPKINRTFRAAP